MTVLELFIIDLYLYSSYIGSLDWIKNKNVTINPKNKNDDNCVQFAIAALLNYQQIHNHPERISKIKHFINKYDWKDIKFPSHREDKGHKSIKGIPALFRGITSKHVGDFYCLNRFGSFRTENVLKNHERVCRDHDYCYIKTAIC